MPFSFKKEGAFALAVLRAALSEPKARFTAAPKRAFEPKPPVGIVWCIMQVGECENGVVHECRVTMNKIVDVGDYTTQPTHKVNNEHFSFSIHKLNRT